MNINQSWYHRPKSAPQRLSAGGVVVRSEHDQIYIALIREVGFPDYFLPKGGVKKGESLIQAARREIAEETGLTALHLIEKLGVRERFGYGKKRWITSHYFLFLTEQVQGIATDAKHPDGAIWFPLNDFPPLFWNEQKELIQTHYSRIVQSVEDRSAQFATRCWSAG